MINATLYYRRDCPACDEADTMLDELQARIPHRLAKLDVSTAGYLLDAYSEESPVVEAGPYTLKWPFTITDLEVMLNAAQHRRTQLENTDDIVYQKRLARGAALTGADKLSFWLGKYYIWLFNLIVFLYIGVPVLAPIFMKAGLTTPANVIYKIYSPLCHQLSFRSFFLFGEQLYYPRELADVESVRSYEEIIGVQQLDFFEARRFSGDKDIGYKIALCQRCSAIYGAMLLFGLVFALTGRRIKPLPWYLWVIIGLVPIGVDGLSQLPGISSGYLPAWVFDWVPIRESTPFLRALTGTLFGLTTSWYLYPFIEESMQETSAIVVRKKAVIDQIETKPPSRRQSDAVQ